MADLKIAVYTMAKNESQHVARFCETTADADVVVVTDTGSTDNTVELLRAGGVQVHIASIMPWRFDMATNVALCNVPADIDVCVKLDLDEVLWAPPGKNWRDAITDAWVKGKTTQLQYLYTWSWKVAGKTPAIQFRTGNIHARSGYLWQHPGHAALTCALPTQHVVFSSDIEIHHYATSKSRPDYLPLLERAVDENECPRTLFYLAREYAGRKMHDHAVNCFEKYLAHPKSHWKAERAEAMRLLGCSFAGAGQQPQALMWFMRATCEYPAAREPWSSLTRFMYEFKDFNGAIWAGTRALKITSRDSGYVSQLAEAWSGYLYVIVAACQWHYGHQADAVATLTDGLKHYPDDVELRKFAASTGKFEALK